MGWAIEALANVFLEILNDVMRFMMAVIQGISFDNAESFHTLTESVFPALAGFSPIFKYLAWGILTLIAMFKMLQVVFDTEGRAEHPASVLMRTAVAAIGINLSYWIISTFIGIMSKLYIIFYAQMENSIDGGIEGMIGDSSAFAMFGSDLIDKYQWGEGIGLTILMAMIGVTLTTYFFMVIMEFLQRYVVIDIMFVSSPLAFATIGSRDTVQIFKKWCSAFFANFLVMFLILVILGTFIGGFQYIASGQHYIDTIEKYPESTYKSASEYWAASTSTGHADTVKWLGTDSQGRDMWETSSGGTIYARTINGRTVYENADGSPAQDTMVVPRFIFHDGKDFAYSMLLLLALAIMGTKIDQYIRDLGLTVFQTGEGMGRALLGSAMILREGVRGVSNGIRGGVNFGKGLVTGNGQGFAGGAGALLHKGGEKVAGGIKTASDPLLNGKRMLDGRSPLGQSRKGLVDDINSSGQARALTNAAIGESGLNKLERQTGFHNASYAVSGDGRSIEVTGNGGQKQYVANTDFGRKNPDLVGRDLGNGYYAYTAKSEANSRLASALKGEGISTNPIEGINGKGDRETAMFNGKVNGQDKVFSAKEISGVPYDRAVKDPSTDQVVGYEYGLSRDKGDAGYLLDKAGYEPARISDANNIISSNPALGSSVNKEMFNSFDQMKNFTENLESLNNQRLDAIDQIAEMSPDIGTLEALEKAERHPRVQKITQKQVELINRYRK